MVPQAFTDAQANFLTALAVPDQWLGAYATADYEITITASDIWNNTTSLTVSAIPEPSTYAALSGALAFGLALWRRRRLAVAATA
jgi:hypothetical protein